MLVNTAVYALTAVASFVMRDFLYSIHSRMFNMDKGAVDKSTQTYLANFKLLITVFNFAPWIAILIVK